LYWYVWYLLSAYNHLRQQAVGVLKASVGKIQGEDGKSPGSGRAAHLGGGAGRHHLVGQPAPYASAVGGGAAAAVLALRGGVHVLDAAFRQVEPHVGVQVVRGDHLQEQFEGELWPSRVEQRQGYVVQDLKWEIYGLLQNYD
jgi:hypothetical protein